MATTQVRAAIYTRISRDVRGDMLGVDRQRKDCLAFCKSRGWEAVEILTDDDVSAYSRRRVRRGYRRLLQLVKDGNVNAVVAWHPDRLHRSPVELEGFIDIVEASGAKVATVQGGDYDLATASGRMNARIVGAVARHESEHKSERIRAQREQLALAGGFQGGRRPFGYTADGLTVVEAEAALIREAAERVLAGETLREIATDWNDRKIRPRPARRGTSRPCEGSSRRRGSQGCESITAKSSERPRGRRSSIAVPTNGCGSCLATRGGIAPGGRRHSSYRRCCDAASAVE